jgi:hypothetical protein
LLAFDANAMSHLGVQRVDIIGVRVVAAQRPLER